MCFGLFKRPIKAKNAVKISINLKEHEMVSYTKPKLFSFES